jgi:hypothetical protein
MNKAQVNGMRGQSRTWSSTIVPTGFFTECVNNDVTIYNPHLIVGYYHLWGMPLYMNFDFSADFPIVRWESIYPNTQGLPFDGMNYASNYAYTTFSSQTQTKTNGTPFPDPPSPIDPVTLSNYNYSMGEQFYYWYKTINDTMSDGRKTNNPNNPFVKTTSVPDQVGTSNVTSINNNFASFSSFNIIDMLDESYCDLSKYFVHNTTTAWGGVVRNLDQANLNNWITNFACADFFIHIMYMDRGHGFEFDRQVIL